MDSPILRRLVVNTGTNFGFRLFSLLLALVSVPVLVGAVGAEGYGLMLLAGSLMGYFNLFNAGVPAGTVKYVAEFEARRDFDRINEIITSSFVFFLFAGVMIAGTVAAFAGLGGITLFKVTPAQHDAATRLLYMAAAIAVASWPLSTLGQTLDGLQRYPENRLARGVGDLLSKGLAIGAALAGLSLEVIFLASQVGIFLTSALQQRALRKVLPSLRLHPSNFSTGTLRMMFSYSVWMLLNQIAVLLIYQTDRIILGLFLPVASLTVYHVVTTPFRYIQELSALYNSALTPAISAVEARQGRAGLDSFIYIVSRYSNAFVAPLAVLGVFLSGPFIELWMGVGFREYAWIAQAACLFQLLWQSNSTLGRVFYGSGKVRAVTLIALFSAVVNVPLGIWWVQEIGLAGVVFATVAAGVIAIPLQYLFALPELAIDRGRYLQEAIVRGQWTSWVVGLLLVPLWGTLQSIDSWYQLAVVACGLGVLLYGAAWRCTVAVSHRQALRRLLPA